ncbi:MAG: carboxypeptidase regulatory-like domain-containing protein, partial [Spiribacter salinus]
MHLATAQEAALTVSVVDNRSYERVADYEVTLANDAIGFSATRTTDNNGQVTFRGLSTSGTYTAEAPDTEAFLGTASRPIQLVSGQRSSVILTLFSADTVEMEGVEVRARSTQINTVDGRVASELSAGALETLPVEGRDITRALFRLPNIS